VKYKRKKKGLLCKCWKCGYESKIWKINCDNCKIDKMEKDDNNNVFDYKKENNVYYVATSNVRGEF
jgi:hypothetical protein